LAKLIKCNCLNKKIASCLYHETIFLTSINFIFMKKVILVLCVLCFHGFAFGQGWIKYINYSNSDSTLNVQCKITTDTGFILTENRYGSDSESRLLKFNKNGNIEWTYSFQRANFVYICEASYGFVRVEKNITTKRLNLTKVSKKGQLESVIVGDTIDKFELREVYSLPNDEILMSGGYADANNTYRNGVLRKISSIGKIIWETALPSSRDIFKMKIVENKYHCMTFSTGIFVVNDKGMVEKFVKAPVPSLWFDVFQNGDYAVGDFYGKLNKVSSNGIDSIGRIWLSPFTTKSGNIRKFDFDVLTKKNVLTLIDSTGKLISKKNIEGLNFPIDDAYETPDSGFILQFYASRRPFRVDGIAKIDKNGDIYFNNLYGKIVFDKNKNCKTDSSDQILKNGIVSATSSDGLKSYSTTDSLGVYSMNLDTGSYTIKTEFSQSANLWQPCTPSVSKTFSSLKKTDTVDFLLKPIIDCPAMNVQVSTPFLRRCFNNTYTVTYCNRGTVKAQNAYVTVTLDSLLEYINSSKSITSQSGRTLRFNLGDVAVDDCGSFDITTRVRCGDSTRLGQTLCVEAKIYPDTVCSDLSLWSGASMEITGSCLKDSVLFQIKNVGRAASSSLNSIVIEDEVLFLRQPVQLPQNGVFSKKFPANGKTWRMVVNQEPNHPTSFNPTAFVEGCRANNTLPFSTGFATRFPNDDKATTIDVDCQIIQGAFDPNDKIGYPTGYKNDHFVAQNQDIEYKIRFQNTGTDTAFTVVVRDTISDKMDISSIEFGASSHKYEAEIYGKGILKFTFNNINLVDSFKNEPKSHGFIQYRIKQKKDLIFGTKIYNSAGIYFDFNDPVLTNQTLHTVGAREIISAVVERTIEPNFAVKISPNPFSESAVFETPLSPDCVGMSCLHIQRSFELFDITGKMLRKEAFVGTTFEFYRKDLSAGIYVFKISEGGKLLSVGKLVVQ
jgi:uncharacterized repeat protein (TIGR01451 family)